jgi:hypothetical protein
MLSYAKWGAVVALALALGASGARADQPTAAGVPAESSALTAQGLKKMMQDMGYVTKDFKNIKGEMIGVSFKVLSHPCDYYVSATLSGDHQWVYLGVWLKPLPTPKVPADKLKKLLSLNEIIGPAYFSYSERNNEFRLTLPIYNQGIKPAVMRAVLGYLDTDINQYGTTWDPEKWVVTKPPAVKQKG